MAYKVVYETPAEAVRRSLPLRARMALAARMRLIAASPHPGKTGKDHGGGRRYDRFGNNGLVVYRVADAVILVTVIDVTLYK
jgi:hypothetical protein